ncbi:hypothetical protein KCP78_19840 [Salmonella enterica subsp. enterica]|nr:hypothetical protein KCP78_19840 [Salmonella enterica subsp. enterica]
MPPTRNTGVPSSPRVINASQRSAPATRETCACGNFYVLNAPRRDTIGIFKFRRRYQRADFRLSSAVSSFGVDRHQRAFASVDHRQTDNSAHVTCRASHPEVIHAASKRAAALLVMRFPSTCA